MGTPREGFILLLGPRDCRYHFLAAIRDSAKKRWDDKCQRRKYENRILAGGRRGEGIQSLDFLLEAAGQEVRVEAER